MSSALSPTDRARRRVAHALRAVVLFVFPEKFQRIVQRARPRPVGPGPPYGPAVNDVLATIRLRIAELSLNAWSVALPDVHIETLPELPTLTI